MICPCDGSGYPDVYFSSNGYDLKVTPENYLDKLSGAYCMLGLMVGAAPYALFGDVFLRDYFYAMDKLNNKVGLYGFNNLNHLFFSIFIL